jgi:cytochrome c556
MGRKAILAALALGVFVVLQSAGARTADAPSVKEIMKKANSPTGIYANLRQDLNEDSPSWPTIQQEAKDLAQLIAQLPQATPPRGGKESWAKLTKDFADKAKALQQATAKMDQDAAKAAWAKMGGDTCKTCHAAHRPPE